MRWPDRIADSLPTTQELAGRRYWNFKIPAFAKAVEPPHATAETRRAAFAALFAAAASVETAPNRPAGARVAVLATTPFLFESEVTLFADEAYFRSFLPGPSKTRTDIAGGGWIEAEAAQLAERDDGAPPAPAALAFMGATRLTEFDPERGGAPVSRINWVWAYPRR